MKNSIKDIAKKANVSVSTVSRVLNNSKFVREELKERVLEVVKETGFKPNLVARGLVNKKTKLIGVLIPRISNNFFATLIEGVEEVAQSYGYSILLSSSTNCPQKEVDYLNIFKERQLDGIIFSVTEFSEQQRSFFDTADIPTVFVGQKMDDCHYPYVTIDNRRASYEATRYLINQNHKKIAILRGPENDMATGVERFLGFKQALQEEGLPVNQAWQSSGYHTLKDGYIAASKIMSHFEKPTAIFACSDLQALGAINYLQEQGCKIPEDISVIGFDDVDLASIFTPKLTTIKQNPFDMGATAMRLLIDQIENKETLTKETLIPYRLIVRESTTDL